MKKLLMSQEALGSMLEMPLLSYTSDMTKNDNAPDTLSRALALFSLLLHEHETGDGCAVDRICEHLCAVISERSAPAFDAICLWSYCPFSASIALAKSMPSVWERLTAEVKERLAFAMEMYAYLESFATSDFNAYRTGPGLTGNYGKTWNPNYRLANVPVMVFVTHFFGNGDMKQGAENVNNMLHSFDEKTYERVVDTLDKYGWHRAKAVWTTPARMHEDGTYGTDARHVLLYGGTTYTSQYAHTP
ncbi:MAG: hypothetical protein IJY04_05300, partial [Clostridia bacterium]|nr:hypothetical protein [Clostridia bacterium]